MDAEGGSWVFVPLNKWVFVVWNRVLLYVLCRFVIAVADVRRQLVYSGHRSLPRDLLI